MSRNTQKQPKEELQIEATTLKKKLLWIVPIALALYAVLWLATTAPAVEASEAPISPPVIVGEVTVDEAETPSAGFKGFWQGKWNDLVSQADADLSTRLDEIEQRETAVFEEEAQLMERQLEFDDRKERLNSLAASLATQSLAFIEEVNSAEEDPDS